MTQWTAGIDKSPVRMASEARAYSDEPHARLGTRPTTEAEPSRLSRCQNEDMARRSRLSKLAVWAAAFALILRAGVPLLAAGAAQMRGVAVADVCEVYGVALPAAAPMHEHGNHAHHHAGHSGHDPHPGDAHSGDHCALTALGALAASYLAVTDHSQPQTNVCDLAASTRSAIHDASATWTARRKHGPPLFA